MRPLLLAVFLCAPVFAAGPLIIGGRGGAALNDSTSYSFGGRGVDLPGASYTIGPTLGVRLPVGFSVEGDALYNRQTLGVLPVDVPGLSQDWWEFPVMLKFTPGRSWVAPVLGAGVTVRHIRDFGGVPSFLLTRSTSSTSVGFVAGGGVRFKAGPVAITPEVRYSRWDSGSFAQSVADLFGGRNQVQLLVGLTF